MAILSHLYDYYILSSNRNNSVSMIYRMFSIEIDHFHTDMVNNYNSIL